LKGNFADNQICFALTSMADKIDDSVTVKFIWICWLGNSVGTMMKARLSTQLGAVKEFMGV
jgi:formate/nitrite transporter FocA (FNT family)